METTALPGAHDHAWVVVSKSALRHNVEQVRSLLAKDSHPAQLMCVVKANGFGHGAVESAQTFAEAGADYFATTTSGEALALRKAGISGRILAFAPPLPDQIPDLIRQNIEVTVWDPESVNAVARAAEAAQQDAAIHVKVDTGMGRIGVCPASALDLVRLIHLKPCLRMAGIYTHFARALEMSDEPVRLQFARFQDVLQRMHEEGMEPGLRHCCNSAAALRFPDMRMDAVRVGTLLYGQYPSDVVPRALDLRDTWRLQSRVISVKEVKAGTPVGYGGEFVTKRTTRLAVIPVGYADGFGVVPSSVYAGWRGVQRQIKALIRPGPAHKITIRHKDAPVVGRISMQLCTIDVTDIPGASVGDIVTIPTRRVLTNSSLPRIYGESF